MDSTNKTLCFKAQTHKLALNRLTLAVSSAKIPPQSGPSKDTEIRYWLLDAAIYQYSESFFPPKRRVYLPDEVFGSPGMSETEMVHYLVQRGASTRCIRFALSRYRTTNSSDLDLTMSTSSDTWGQDSDFSTPVDGGAWSEDRGRESLDTKGHSRWKNLVHRFKGLFI